MTTTPKGITPFILAEYSRDHIPAAARRGMRGYVLTLLIGMVRLKGKEMGTCFPSIPYIAKRIGRSVRQTQRIVRELEGIGIIERDERRRKDEGQSSNLYRVRGLLTWIKERVTGGGDTGVRQTSYEKKSKKAGQWKRREKAVPTPREAQRPVRSEERTPPAKWRGLTAVEVQEARERCEARRWAVLREDAARDGVTGDDLDAAAAWRWRAAAIMAGVL